MAADLDFELEYDGPALAAHEMDVRELAPALISTADFFQELNRTLYPANPDLTVNIRATTEGSFVIQLGIVTTPSLRRSQAARPARRPI